MGIECCSNLRDNDDDSQNFQNEADTFKKRFPFLIYDIKSFFN